MDTLLDVCTGKLVATDKDQESLNYPETVCKGKLVAPGYEGYPGNPGTPGNSEDSETEGRILATSFQCITRLRTSHGESLLDCKTDLWSKSDG